MTILETDRLLIRELSASDAPLLCAYSQEECARRELPDEVLDSAEAGERLILFFNRRYTTKEYPLVYAIVLRKSGLLIGHISLSPIDDGVEIGYAIALAQQGNGYAKEAVRSFAQWGKRAENLNKLYGYAKASNTASWKVLEAVGFTLFDEREREFFGGTYMTRHYSI